MNFKLLAISLLTTALFLAWSQPSWATSPTPEPAGPSPTPPVFPLGAEDEKVTELRQAIKEKVNEIKDKIEKKAYVGLIGTITETTLTISNFRGQQRVRYTSETVIIDANKKEVASKELAVEDKVIVMGTVDGDEILDAKRIVVIPKPKTPPTKRLIWTGTISNLETSQSRLALTDWQDRDSQEFKVDRNSTILSQTQGKELGLKELDSEQRVIVVYPESTTTPPVIKTMFILPSPTLP